MRRTLRKTWQLAIMAVLGIVSLISVSCGGGSKGDKPGPAPTTENLSVSPSTLSLAAGASGQISVTSNVAWTVSAPSGYTATPTSGSNNGTITVKASATAAGGTLTVKGKSKSASVTLTSTSGTITLEPESISIPSEATGVTFKINCSGTWSVTLPNPKPTWLTGVTPSSGTGNATVTVNTGKYLEKTKDQTFLTIKSGSNTKYFTITKEAAKNNPPSKPTGLKPSGSNVETITTFSWNASTDPDPSDKVQYTVMLSKDNSNWKSFDPTEKTSVLNTVEMEKNTTYYYKVVADDGYEGGKVESDVVTFTTGSTKSYWADGEVRLYDINPDGSITEVSSTSRPFKLIYTGDGYTQDLYKYGGQFDEEIDKGIKALFQVEPYKYYYNYFAVYKVAAYSNEAGMSSGSTNWDEATTKVDTKFKCSWEGGNSTGIGCDTKTVEEYAAKCPGYKGATDAETRTNLSWSPISVIINADQYAGTNIWSSGMGGMKMISIAQTPARHPSSGSYGGFEYTLRHEYGGHGIGLLGDEYVYYRF